MINVESPMIHRITINPEGFYTPQDESYQNKETKDVINWSKYGFLRTNSLTDFNPVLWKYIWSKRFKRSGL